MYKLFLAWPGVIQLMSHPQSCCVCVPSLGLLPFLAILASHQEEMCPGGTQPILLQESSCICIPSFRSVADFCLSGIIAYVVPGVLSGRSQDLAV